MREHEMRDVRDTYTLTVDTKSEQGVIYSNPRFPKV